MSDTEEELLAQQRSTMRANKQQGEPPLYYEIGRRKITTIMGQLAEYQGGTIRFHSYNKHEACFLIRPPEDNRTDILRCPICTYLAVFNDFQSDTLDISIEPPDPDREFGTLCLLRNRGDRIIVRCFCDITIETGEPDTGPGIIK